MIMQSGDIHVMWGKSLKKKRWIDMYLALSLNVISMRNQNKAFLSYLNF